MKYELWILKTSLDGVSKSVDDELVVTFEPDYKELAIEFARNFIDNYKVPQEFEECEILLESVVYDEDGNGENIDTLIDCLIEK